MKFVLLAIHMGFWCSCNEPPIKLAEYSTMQACQEALARLKTDDSNRYICSENNQPKGK